MQCTNLQCYGIQNRICKEYFYARKLQNKYVNDSVIKELILSANGFDNFSELVMHFSDEMINEDIFDNNLKRVLNGEPLQYVLGYSYFLNLKLVLLKKTFIRNTIMGFKNFWTTDFWKILSITGKMLYYMNIACMLNH